MNETGAKENQPDVLDVLETSAEEPKKKETQEDISRDSLIPRLSNQKAAMDFNIESRARLIQSIFHSLENGVEPGVTLPEKEMLKPEAVLRKIEKNISRLSNPTIDDISSVLTSSGMEMAGIKSGLLIDRTKIESLANDKKNLGDKNDEFSARLAAEEKRNFFVKIFRGKMRRELADQIKEISVQRTKTEFLIEDSQSAANDTESVIERISKLRQDLCLKASQQLFQEVIEQYNQFHENLTTPEVKQALNSDLIAKEVEPALWILISNEDLTVEEANEYIELLKAQLAEDNQRHWDEPPEKEEVRRQRRKRIEELNQQSDYQLRDIGNRVDRQESLAADNHYNEIFNFLLREETRSKVEQLYNSLKDSLSPELQNEFERIFTEKNMILDNNNLPIKEFDRLTGLERWQIVKNFTKNSNIISRETFSRTEKIIINRLFKEELFPGGRESWSGTYAAIKLGALENPEALPLMLRHIESSGVGHTNNAVAYEMEKLMQKSNPTELQQVLEALPKNKRALLQTMVDENSYMSRFGRCNSRYITCDLLQKGDITLKQEQYAKLLEETGLPEEELGEFYLLFGDREKILEQIKKVSELAGEDKKQAINNYFEVLTSYIEPESPESLKIIDALSNELEVPKTDLLVRCVEKFEKPRRNHILRKVVSPDDKDYASFPLAFSKLYFGLEKDSLEKLAKVYQTKSLQTSSLEREFFLEGLLLLKGKENGKIVLDILLDRYKGAKDDPKRMRRIFQTLSTLDGFGEYGLAVPNPDKEMKINQEIFNLQNQYSQTQDKAGRKVIKNRIEGLNSDRQNLTGLKGIEDAMIEKVVSVACRRLELPPEFQKKIENNLDELLKNGVFEIVPTLAGKYEEKDERETKNLLKIITSHIIEGDFKSWRYSHERSEKQLSGLTEEQKDYWIKASEPVTLEIESSRDEKEKRAEELRAAQEIILNAKEHIINSQPDFDFSKERARTLTEKTKELTEKIKLATSPDEKQKLIAEKRNAQAIATLINGLLEIENATPQSFAREKIVTQARELSEKMVELNMPLANLDLEQMEKIFTVGDIKSVKAYESDDPLTLLNIGVEPQETCQSWRNGGFNECLLAYVADSNKKVINVADEEGRIIARSVIKLNDYKNENDTESKTQKKTILLEKPYSLRPNIEVYRAFARVLLAKAQGLDSSITLSNGLDQDIIKIFEEEARAFGYEINEGKFEIYIPPSLNKYEYSDSLGGKIEWFDRYQTINATTFEKIKS
ncbi:MAG: hypothetical protein WC528_04970 [Patescibacteria group bacterium]